MGCNTLVSRSKFCRAEERKIISNAAYISDAATMNDTLCSVTVVSLRKLQALRGPKLSARVLDTFVHYRMQN